MNDWKGRGRLTRDPFKVERTDGISMCFITLAINRGNAEQTDYISVSCYEEVAEAVLQYKKEGDEVLVDGTIQSYTKDGRTELQPTAKRVIFLRNKQENVSSVKSSHDGVSGETSDDNGESLFNV